MSLRENIERIREKITLQRRDTLIKIWEGINIGILGLNSFIMVYLREQGHVALKYVICSGALAYALAFLIETLLLRNHPQKLVVIRKTKKIFRLIYAAIYLTVIMINIIEVSEQPNPARMMAYYGAMFIWAALWGTNCLWIGKLYPKLVNLYRENKPQIISFFKRFYGE